MATNQTTLTPAQQAGAQAASSISAAVAIIKASGATERTDANLKALARGFHEGYMASRLGGVDVSEVTGKFAPLDLQPGKEAPYKMNETEKLIYSCSKERWSEACTFAGLAKLAVGRGQGAGKRKGGQDKPGAALDASKADNVETVLDLIGAADVAFQSILKGKPKALTGDCGARIRTMFGEFHESLTDALKAFEADKATAPKAEPRKAADKVKAAEDALAETRAQLKAMQEQMLALQAKAA